MPTINPEVVNGFAELQGPVWDSVSRAASDAFNTEITFTAPLTIGSKPEDVLTEISGPMLVLQFSFSHIPDSPQQILLAPDTVKAIITASQGSPVEEIDDPLINENSERFATLVQGLCQGISLSRGQTYTPGTIGVQHEILRFPQNLQESDEVLRVQVGITGTDVTGTLTWLLDEKSARDVLGIKPAHSMTVEETPEEEFAAPTPFKSGSKEERDIERLLDIPLEVSVELGRIDMLVQDIVDLTSGSIIELEKAAGEPVDVLVNGLLVARGEVIVIEDNFGVRLTEIVSPQERVAKLSEAA